MERKTIQMIIVKVMLALLLIGLSGATIFVQSAPFLVTHVNPKLDPPIICNGELVVAELSQKYINAIEVSSYINVAGLVVSLLILFFAKFSASKGNT